MYAHARPTFFFDPDGNEVFLANDTSEGRMKALHTITPTLTVEEQRNVHYARTEDGRYQLKLRNPDAIDVEDASPGYGYLKQRIEEPDLDIEYVVVEEKRSYVTRSNETVSHAVQSGRVEGKAGDLSGGLTVEVAPGVVDVVVPEGGHVQGVLGLSESGEKFYVEQPDYLIGPHELYGEVERFTPDNRDKVGPLAKIEADEKAIEIENEIRAFHGEPLRSGLDHGYFQDSTVVTATPIEPEKKEQQEP
jgi:hypothetical protein